MSVSEWIRAAGIPAVAAAALPAVWLIGRKKKNPVICEMETKYLLMIWAAVCFGLFVSIYDAYCGTLAFDETLSRPAAGESAEENALTVSGGENEEDISVHVSARERKKKEALAAIEAAKDEINETVCGKNPSVNAVSFDLTVKETYQNGAVAAVWSFSDPSVISSAGRVDLSKVERETTLTAEAELTCGEEKSIYSFPVRVTLPDERTKEGFDWYVSDALEKEDERSAKENSFTLPKKAGSLPISWKRPVEYRGTYFALLGILAAGGMAVGQREEKRRARKRRLEGLVIDYPNIVGSLSLYVSAGVTVKGAFGRIAAQYEKEKKQAQGSKRRAPPEHPGYEVLAAVTHEMEDGAGERRAYEDLARLADQKDYGKLSMLLIQNVKKGSRELAATLEKEEAEAFAKRKIRARVAGEEASTKLLVPMLMLLAVVLAVMIMPTMMSMNF